MEIYAFPSFNGFPSEDPAWIRFNAYFSVLQGEKYTGQ